MAKNNSEEINFQHFVDGVKVKKISWNYFVDFIQVLSYSDIDRLRKLNAILLKELTMNFSDIEKLKYLNEILLIQFKTYIEMTENDHSIENLLESNVDEILYAEKTTELLTNKNAQAKENDYVESLQETNIGQVLNAETFKATTIEMLKNEDIQKTTMNEIRDELITSCKEDEIECNPNDENNLKIFLCHICNKNYKINFHLKQHIKNVHEKKKNYNFHNETLHNDQELATTSISNDTNFKTQILFKMRHAL